MTGLFEGGNEPPCSLKAVKCSRRGEWAEPSSAGVCCGQHRLTTAKGKKGLVGSLLEKKQLLKDALKGMVNGRRVRGKDIR
ncbi:hypothetical protein ANN_19611 [Periplaneta americana]|uniref:Uncharacterized protein n=1 Tax=Periplaneta americana TaxID=6978 RepID=A0ABQ8SAS1_PERAM|nr:hypothetical protein ANN_19611 [Periplaneta americana]